MQLPNRESAYIPLPKLTEYLLSETHAVGRSKAKFFRMHGFTEYNVEMLEEGLLAIARSEPTIEVNPSPYGTKYVIEGSMETPNGAFIRVRTVWIIEAEEDRPRFVTAHPA